MRRALQSIIVITGGQLVREVRDHATPIWLVALPLLIIYILGITVQGLFASDGFTPAEPFRVAVVKSDTALLDEMNEVLRSLPAFFDVTVVADEARARQSVLQKESEAAVIGSDSAESPASPITIVSAPGSVLGDILDEVARSVALQVPQGDGVTGGPPVRVDVTRVAAEGELAAPGADTERAPWLKLSSFQYFSIGITAMFAMFSAHSAMIFSAGDRTTGAYARMRALGVTRPTYLVAGYVSSVVMCAAFLTFMTGATSLLFGVKWGDPLTWIVITLIGAAGLAAISFLVMSVVPRDPKSVENAGSTLFTVLAFLGGSTMPLHVLPEWLASMFAWLPNRVLLDSYINLAIGGTVSAVSGELLTLGLSALALLALSWTVLGVRAKGEA